MMNQLNKKQQNLTLGDDKNSLMLIMGALLMLFFLSKFLMIGYWLSGKSDARFANEILSFLYLSSNSSMVAMRPWTIFTNSWLHDGDLLFISNMLWLAAFGYITQDLDKRTTLIPNYLVSSFIGSMIFVLVNLIISPYNYFYYNGSSAALLAIATTITVYAPQYKIFPRINGGLPLWILAVLLFITKIFQAYTSPISIQIAYLAAIVWGLLYGNALKKGKDILYFIHQFLYNLNNLFNPDKKQPAPPTTQYNYVVDEKPPFQKQQIVTQKRIDEILDKINQQGYRYLTEEEKKLLQKAADDEEI